MHLVKMDFSSDAEIFVVADLLKEEKNQRKRKADRKVWVKEIHLKRTECGEYHTVFPELLRDPEDFFEYFRMSSEKFFKLVDILPLSKQNTTFRESIGPAERLAITLKFLGHGDSFTTISSSYRVGHSTVREIIYDTCRIIWKTLEPIVMPKPTEETWRKIEQQFLTLRNFPNCIGAINGKQVVIETPKKSKCLKQSDIVFLALVDADCKFISVDVGPYGQNSGGGMWKASAIGQALASDSFNIPAPKPLPGTDVLAPYVFVCNESFPMTKRTLRPYPKNYHENNDENKVYNYRHCRARKVGDKAFDSVTKKFHIYKDQFKISSEHIVTLVLATTALHNYLIDDKCAWRPGELDESVTANAFENLPGIGGSAPGNALNTREKLRDYFCSNFGSVPWQWQKAFAGKKGDETN